MSMSTNNDVYANTDARKAIRSRLAAAHSLLVNYGAYEDAMNSLDWAEKAHYESIVDEIGALVNVMPINDGTAADLDQLIDAAVQAVATRAGTRECAPTSTDADAFTIIPPSPGTNRLVRAPSDTSSRPMPSAGVHRRMSRTIPSLATNDVTALGALSPVAFVNHDEPASMDDTPTTHVLSPTRYISGV